DPGVGPVRLLDHRADRGRRERDVVVAERVERRALDDGQDLVGGGGETGCLVEPADVGGWLDARDPRGDVGGRRGRVDDQRGQVRVVLGGDRREALLEPGAWFVGHHHRHDRRGDGTELVLVVVPGRG